MARLPLTDAWSIDDGYFDAMGEWRETSDATRRAIVAAMGGDGAHPPVTSSAVLVLRAGDAARARGDLVLEDGRRQSVREDRKSTRLNSSHT